MNLDFSYRISDERLAAWAAVPLQAKLRMLDNLRQFTLAMRAAPVVDRARPRSVTSSQARHDWTAGASDQTGRRRPPSR